MTQELARTDPLLVQAFSSILPVESRHDAFFRMEADKVPNPTPFETGIYKTWAHNVGLRYVIPGSCPMDIPVTILPTLYTNVSNSGDNIQLSWDPMQASFTAEYRKPLFAAWINQLNKPIYTNITMTGEGTGNTTIPQELNGATFMAVTSQQPLDQEAVEFATLAGPVLLELE